MSDQLSSAIWRPEVIAEVLSLHSALAGLARTSLDAAIRLGELLTEVKKDVGHGRWGEWLTDNVPFTDRTARRYMLVYESREMLKTDNVSDLSAAYALCIKAKSESDDLKAFGRAINSALDGMERLIMFRDGRGYRFEHGTFEDYLRHELGMDLVNFNARLMWCKDYLAAWYGQGDLEVVVLRFINSATWKSRIGASEEDLERLANMIPQNPTPSDELPSPAHS